MFKKILSMALVAAISAGIAVGGTIAYLQSQDSDVNVMTLGNVKIEQHEYERAVNADGTYKTDTIDNRTSYVLKEFTQAKPLYPIVGDPNEPGNSPAYAGWDETTVRMSQVGSYGGMQVFAGKNAQDKFVTVENTGKSDAYVRTLVAIEIGSTDGALIKTSARAGDATQPWIATNIGEIVIGDNTYMVVEYLYRGASDVNRHVNGILPAGDTTYPNLAQIYLKHNATNEDMVAIDGNGNGTLDIMVLSQAIQVEGFEKAADAFAVGFPMGENNANLIAWFEALSIPTVFSHEGVNYVTAGDTASVSSNGGDTIYRYVLSDGMSTVSNVEIGEGIARLNNRALCKAPALTTVTLPSTLTYIDESVFQQSGITEIEIPENVTYIGKTAFGACPNLEKIVIKAKDVTIANYVARACANLKEVRIESDSVTFESGSMYFTNTENADASGITFYVKDQAMADAAYAAFSTSHSYGMLIKSLDGATTFYNTLK